MSALKWLRGFLSVRVPVLITGLRKHRRFLRGSIAEYLIVMVIFFLLTAFYTDGVIFHGNTELFIEGPGDGTSGFLWLNFASNENGGYLGHTDFINYPQGENLSNPTYITYASQLVPLLALSKLAGPVMSLNIITYAAFIACGLVMYWFVKKMFGSRLVALFAGYAAAFVPYHVANSSSHLSYIFSVVFILIAAALHGFMLRPSIKRAFILAGSIALAFYTDGYFILLASVYTATLLIGYLIYYFISERVSLRQCFLVRIKLLFVAAGVLMLLLSPMVYVQFTHAKSITGNLAQSRGAIRDDVQLYSSRTMDFLIPSVNHPLLKDNKDFQLIEQYKNSRSNAMENTLYVGYTLIVLCVIAVVGILTYAFKRPLSTLASIDRRTRNNIIIMGISGVVTVPLLVIWMYGVQITIFHITIPTPTGFLVNHGVALWRVYSRMFLPLHISIVLMAASGLYIVRQWFKGKNIVLFGCIVALLFGALGLEYATDTNRPAYDFGHIPSAYYWLKKQSDVNVVAELPFTDRPLEINYNYVTAQIVHQKKLINSHLTTGVIGAHTALGGIENQEAVDYAIERGAQAIITHDVPCRQQLSWGKLAYEESNKIENKEAPYYGKTICIYKVSLSQPRILDNFFIQLEKGSFADAPIIKNHEEYALVYGEKGVLTVRDQLGKAVAGQAELRSKTVMSPDATISAGSWQVWQQGRMLQQGAVGTQIDVLINASEPIELHFQYPDNKVVLYQYALTDVSVTHILHQ